MCLRILLTLLLIYTGGAAANELDYWEIRFNEHSCYATLMVNSEKVYDPLMRVGFNLAIAHSDYSGEYSDEIAESGSRRIVQVQALPDFELDDDELEIDSVVIDIAGKRYELRRNLSNKDLALPLFYIWGEQADEIFKTFRGRGETKIFVSTTRNRNIVHIPMVENSNRVKRMLSSCSQG
jgi:hypothetical protein